MNFPLFSGVDWGPTQPRFPASIIRKGHSLSVFSRNSGNDPTSDTWDGVDVHRPRLMNFSDIFSMINPDEIRTWDINGQEFFSDTILYNMLSASKLVNSLVFKDNQHFDLLVSHDWLAALAGIISRRNLGIPLVFSLPFH